jgi:hypothetical protein
VKNPNTTIAGAMAVLGAILAGIQSVVAIVNGDGTPEQHGPVIAAAIAAAATGIGLLLARDAKPGDPPTTPTTPALP